MHLKGKYLKGKYYWILQQTLYTVFYIPYRNFREHISGSRGAQQAIVYANL